MIHIILIGLGVAIITGAFAIMPPLPPAPAELMAISTGMHDVLVSGIQILRYLFSPILMYIVLVVVTAVFLAEPIYHAVMWVLRKIPVLNIN